MLLLPEDIIFDIFEQVGIDDLLRISESSRYFNSLALYTLSIRLNSLEPLKRIRIQKRWNIQKFKLSSKKLERYFIKFVYLVAGLIISCSSNNIINVNNEAFIRCSDDIVACTATQVSPDEIILATSYYSSAPASSVYSISISSPHKIKLLSTIYPQKWINAHCISIDNNLVVYGSYTDDIHILNYKSNRILIIKRDCKQLQPIAAIRLFSKSHFILVLTRSFRLEIYETPQDILDNSNTVEDNDLSSIGSFNESHMFLDNKKASFVQCDSRLAKSFVNTHLSSSSNLVEACKFSQSSPNNSIDQTETCYLLSVSKTHIHKTAFNFSDIRNPRTVELPLCSTREFDLNFSSLSKGYTLSVNESNYFFSTISGGMNPKCTVIDNNSNIVFPPSDCEHMGIITDGDFDENQGKAVFSTSQGYIHIIDYLN